MLFTLSSTDYPSLALRFKKYDFFLLHLDSQALARTPLVHTDLASRSLRMTLIFIYSLIFEEALNLSNEAF